MCFLLLADSDDYSVIGILSMKFFMSLGCLAYHLSGINDV